MQKKKAIGVSLIVLAAFIVLIGGSSSFTCYASYQACQQMFQQQNEATLTFVIPPTAVLLIIGVYLLVFSKPKETQDSGLTKNGEQAKGLMILWGILFSIPLFVRTLLFSKLRIVAHAYLVVFQK